MTSNYSAFGFTHLMRFVFLSAFLIVLVYCFMIVNAQSDNTPTTASSNGCSNSLYTAELLKNYNNTYPLTAPIKSKNFIRYRIGLISDDDRKTGSYEKNKWSAFYLKGYLTYYPSTRKVEIKLDERKNKISNRFSNGRRGLELSELVTFNGKLLACDDKTGIIYHLIEEPEDAANASLKLNETNVQLSENHPFKLVPSLILSDGDGLKEDAFKCEWMAVKDHQLYVGSFGKNFQINRRTKYSEFVKRVNVNGLTEHLNWTSNFLRLKEALKLPEEGYLSHETAMWSDARRKWYFLPRKVSKTAFQSEEDESKGSNVMLEASEDFQNVTTRTVGPLVNDHGFSSSKFLPGFNDEIIVALKSKEVNNLFSSFITVFDINGEVLYPETLIDDTLKLEGIDFV